MIFLVDNGSVRPEAYLNLCAIAAQISDDLGLAVSPAPLLHANKISPKELGGASGREVLAWAERHFDLGAVTRDSGPFPS